MFGKKYYINLEDFVELKCKFNKLLEENKKIKKYIEKLEDQLFQKNLDLMDCDGKKLELEQKVEELENELNLYKKLIKDLYIELKKFEKLNIKKFDMKV
jgi:hypothetical protein